MKNLKIIAVTACLTGVAHTFMAAEKLKEEAEKRNIDFKVQKNGSQGTVDALTPQEIADADYVIIAADIRVDKKQFKDKKVFTTSTKKALGNASWVFDKTLSDAKVLNMTNNEQFFKGKMNAYKHVLTGISFMLPFIIAGGILTAVSFFWGIYSFDKNSDQYNAFAASLKAIGAAGMGLMVPAFAGYIAYSIGDRGALVPGFIGGFLANTGFEGLQFQGPGGDNINYTSGFLGAIAAGLIAGYLVQLLKMATKKVPEKFNTVRPMLIYPLFATLGTGLIMIWGLNYPIGLLQNEINNGLTHLGTQNIGLTIALGTILGILVATDFGGPFNKVAYVFGVADLGTKALVGEKSVIMAAVSAACIMPSLATGVAVTLFPNKFTKDEKSAGYTNYLLGAFHITEPAIPFAAKKPFVNIPMFMVGSVLACVLSLVFGCATAAPHGGLIVAPVVDKWYLWFLAIAIGTMISGVLLGLVASPINAPKQKNYFWLKIMRTFKFKQETKKLSSEQKAAKKVQFKNELATEISALKKDYKVNLHESKVNMVQILHDEKEVDLTNKKAWKVKHLDKKQDKISKDDYQVGLDKINQWFDGKVLINDARSDKKLKKLALKVGS